MMKSKILTIINFNLLIFFPIAFIAGNAVINFYIVLLFFFLFFFKDELKSLIIENKFFCFFLSISYLYFILNSVLISQNLKSILFSIGLVKILIIFLFLRFSFLIFKKKICKIFLIWISFFIFIEIDAVIQLFNGVNIFGFPSEKFFKNIDCTNNEIQLLNNLHNLFFNLCSNFLATSRLGGVFGNELVLGGFITYFFSLLYGINYENYKKIVNFFLILSLFVILFSGERMALILFLFLLTLFFLFHDFKLKKIFYFSIILVFVFLSINLSMTLKKRYFEVFEIVKEIKQNKTDLPYFSIWKLSLHNFKENPFFGVGIKNFRNNCTLNETKKKFIIDKFGDNACTLHSHNFYLEILSETGLFGLFIILFIFLKMLYNMIVSYNNNIYSLGCLISAIAIIFPFKSSGAIFSTFYGTLMFFIFFSSYELIKYNNEN